MDKLYILFTFLHVLAAVVWVGGMVFLALALVPVLKKESFRAQAMPLIRESGRRFRHVSWACLGILVFTGFYALHFRGWLSAGSAFWKSPMGHVFMMKMTLVAVVLVLGALHDFVVGPRAMKAWREQPDAPAARRLRRRASWIGRVNLALSLVIVFSAVILVRGWPF
jgi:uncharacterized membrane protein